ncbi:MAG: response regulator transcription factor [Treponema sp.]|nr:response regulator transcription factor [Treponema sp.]
MRLLLADDQRLFVESLKKVIESDAPDIEIVGIANDGREAVAMAEKLRPDLILMDIKMPKMDGVEAVREILRKTPELLIVMLTTYSDDAYVYDALRLGARGYLLKDISPERLISSIRSVRSDAIMLAPDIALNATARRPSGPPLLPEWFAFLTEREKAILDLVAKGYSNKEIGEHLCLGDQTVRNYVSDLYSKLNVHDRFEAMRIAIEADLGRLLDREKTK